MLIEFRPIGILHTPYIESAPFRPDKKASGEFFIELYPEFEAALKQLEKFSHIIIFYHFSKSEHSKLTAHPPLHGKEVGLFASRSPNRINKIGINIVELKKIEKNRIYTSPTDALDGTPLLDIKPYIKDLDCFPEANNGWQDE